MFRILNYIGKVGHSVSWGTAQTAQDILWISVLCPFLVGISMDLIKISLGYTFMDIVGIFENGWVCMSICNPYLALCQRHLCNPILISFFYLLYVCTRFFLKRVSRCICVMWSCSLTFFVRVLLRVKHRLKVEERRRYIESSDHDKSTRCN